MCFGSALAHSSAVLFVGSAFKCMFVFVDNALGSALECALVVHLSVRCSELKCAHSSALPKHINSLIKSGIGTKFFVTHQVLFYNLPCHPLAGLSYAAGVVCSDIHFHLLRVLPSLS